MTYLADCLAVSEAYERFIYEQLENILGWTVRHHHGREAQKKGENSCGIEIKHDCRMAETGNVFIEIIECTERNPQWRDSGIYRQDNTWLYLVGDRSQAFIFGKKALQREHKSGRWENKNSHVNSSKGFIIPVTSCIELAEKYLVFPKTETAEDLLKEL